MRIQEGNNNKEISFVGLNFVFPKKKKKKTQKKALNGGGEGRGRGRGGLLCVPLHVFYASMFTPAKLAFKIKKENISFEFSW